MSVRWIVAMMVVLPGALACAQPSRGLETPRQTTSYALGVEAGQQFRRRAIDLDPDAFARGLADALSGRTALLSDDQVKAAIAELQADLKQREFDVRSRLAEESRKASEAFLAENAKKDGVVTLPSGLQYQILEAGRGPKPTDEDVVECNYRGTLADGTEFDSSSRGGSSPTIVVSQAILGLREALKLMPVGSRWRVFVPPALAVGPRRATMVIPPNQATIFEVELLAIK